MKPLSTTERAAGPDRRRTDRPGGADTETIAGLEHRRRILGVPWEAVAAAVILVGALVLRIPDLAEPSIEQRENQSSLIARGFYLHGRDDLPAWQDRVLDEVDTVLKPYEPPLMEVAAAGFYRATDGERIWFPRLLASLAWLLGGVLLALLARRVTNGAGLVTAVGLYAVWPYAFAHSRKFMPDSLLVACILAAALTIVRYSERPTRGRFAAAAAVSAVATAIKPGVGIFFVATLFVALALTHRRLRDEITSWRLPLFAAVSLSLALAYYLVGRAFDLLHPAAGQGRLLPERVLTGGFWTGWWDMIASLLSYPLTNEAVAVPPVAVGALGLLLVRRGVPRAVLWGLTAGYVLFALAYARYTASHSYYALPLIPILALAIGVVVGRLDERLAGSRPARAALAATVVAAIGGAAFKAYDNIRLSDAPLQTIADYRRIGEVTDHTTRAIIVNPSLGHPVMYWGWIVGEEWDLGIPTLPEYIDVRGKHYLVVYDNAALESSPGLAAFARGRAVVARNARFTVFDLRT